MTDKAGLALSKLVSPQSAGCLTAETGGWKDELRVSRASIPINDIGTPQSRKGRLAADALRQSIDNLKRELSERF